MIHILIFTAFINSGTAAHSVEFNTLEACQSAAKEMKRQKPKDFPMMVCAAK